MQAHAYRFINVTMSKNKRNLQASYYEGFILFHSVIRTNDMNFNASPNPAKVKSKIIFILLEAAEGQVCKDLEAVH